MFGRKCFSLHLLFDGNPIHCNKAVEEIITRRKYGLGVLQWNCYIEIYDLQWTVCASPPYLCGQNLMEMSMWNLMTCRVLVYSLFLAWKFVEQLFEWLDAQITPIVPVNKERKWRKRTRGEMDRRKDGRTDIQTDSQIISMYGERRLCSPMSVKMR